MHIEQVLLFFNRMPFPIPTKLSHNTLDLLRINILILPAIITYDALMSNRTQRPHNDIIPNFDIILHASTVHNNAILSYGRISPNHAFRANV